MITPTLQRRLDTRSPVELTSFVGRRAEQADVRRSLAGSRLVTLTGVGGVGKSRLALRVAAHRQLGFTDGTWLVELAHVRDPDRVADEVAATFDLVRYPDERTHEALVAHLRDRHALLVLDNCEHLLDACAELIRSVLTGCQRLTVLVTSRQPLGIAGEYVFEVPTLSVPGETDNVDPAALGQFDAVTLLVDRARAVDRTFDVVDRNSAQVAQLCQVLDGIPLAIELAAARLRALSVGDLVEQIPERFDVLNYGNRAGPPRQQTLQATLDWSYELCSEPERLLWARLAVFRGGFELRAVEGICDDAELSGKRVEHCLSGLLDKSVVSRLSGPDPQRYILLETIREYGLMRLEERGQATELRRRHREWFIRQVEQAESSPPAQAVGIYDLLQRDSANLRAALENALSEPDDGVRTLEFVSSLCTPACQIGSMDDQLRWLDRALRSAPADRPERTKALSRGAWLTIRQGDLDSGRRMLAESQGIANATEDPYAIAYTEHLDAVVKFAERNWTAAIKQLRDVEQLHRAVGNTSGVYFTRVHTLFCLCLSGDPRAIAATDDFRKTALEGPFWVMFIHWLRACYRVLVGEVDLAGEEISGALALAPLSKDRWLPVACVETLAWIRAARVDYAGAATVLGSAERMRRAIGCRISGAPYVGVPHQAVWTTVRRELGQEAFEAAFRAGYDAASDDTVLRALADDEEARKASGDDDVLTRRQMEVAGLVAQGMSNQAIADKLVISRRTAETHVEHILTKLGFTSRAQISSWFAAHGRARTSRRA